MRSRRELLQSLGIVTGASAVGFGGVGMSAIVGSDGPTANQMEDDVVPIDATGRAVEYARNIEEVKGHLASSAALLSRERQSDAALHAGHPQDYFAAVLPPLRDADPDLATRLRARLKTPSQQVQTMDASEYEQYLSEEVVPLLDSALESVVADSLRGSTGFGVRVMNALAGRIAEEYAAAVDADGTIRKEGEYWDGRGFLTRIEQRHGNVASDLDGAGSDTLERLRSEIESVEPPRTVRGTTLRFRVETAAAANLPSASVDGRDDALEYVRNVEEVRGHLHSSVALAKAGDESASLHAGHPADYVTTLLVPVQRANPDLAGRVHDRLLSVGERVESMSASAYESHVTDEVFPLLDRVTSVAVPERFTDSTGFSAAVVVALARRLEEEYAAAVTDDEVIELYGEYWDARGFLTRIEERYRTMESALDPETRTAVGEELDVLREELETAAPPDDVAGSVDALASALSDLAEG